MEESYSTIQANFRGLETEMEKVKGGNKAAGKRARKHLMEIINASKQLRKDIQEAKNNA
jgi:hypothetical protein